MITSELRIAIRDTTADVDFGAGVIYQLHEAFEQLWEYFDPAVVAQRHPNMVSGWKRLSELEDNDNTCKDGIYKDFVLDGEKQPTDQFRFVRVKLIDTDNTLVTGQRLLCVEYHNSNQ